MVVRKSFCLSRFSMPVQFCLKIITTTETTDRLSQANSCTPAFLIVQGISLRSLLPELAFLRLTSFGLYTWPALFDLAC